MRSLIRKLIIWALGGEPVLRGPDVPHDAAGLDKEIAALR